ncbi:ASKHA domain-containing protein [Candidatus Chloroploca sp. Khr17]|uniref:ASKHA domain-containing protein n=1 Tax=Candidatus Chloroploca sp. Khr17 TaxID=2496869 RepID=UPI00101DBFB1|nr:ASKHA domain-containing protein [Candidatus Chloroploca sp. Khr17]
MPVVTIKLDEGERHLPFEPGVSLREILDTTDIRVRTACRGIGACGLCRVQIEAGDAGEPMPSEYLHLDDAELARGYRLACQIMPTSDLQVTILARSPASAWRNLPLANRRFDYLSTFPRRKVTPKMLSPYGVAIDLGTTHISLALHTLIGHQCLAGRYGLNPQIAVGSDVITRLAAATEDTEQARHLRDLAVNGIAEALFDLGLREGLNLEQIIRLTLVGNTAMLALLSGRNYAQLLHPRYWMQAIDCLPEDPRIWIDPWGLHPEAEIVIIPPLAGFVGSDLLAGVLTMNLTDTSEPALLIDFGTNSEMALWDGTTLWVTSAAGGPAFEGSGLRCGMPAEPGAIYRVAFRDGMIEPSVIADTAPRGICGSGLVDLIANLISADLLTSVGRFAPQVPNEGVFIAHGERNIVLTRNDVDLFQRAKAAIGTGCQVLLREAGLVAQDLGRICLGGAFGHFLDVRNAQAIGLLPNINPDRVELYGNTALLGCEDLLRSPVACEHLTTLRARTTMINLGQCDDFDELFLENLFLQPS